MALPFGLLIEYAAQFYLRKKVNTSEKILSSTPVKQSLETGIVRKRVYIFSLWSSRNGRFGLPPTMHPEPLMRMFSDSRFY